MAALARSVQDPTVHRQLRGLGTKSARAASPHDDSGATYNPPMFCKTCRYDLRELTTDCCPECGRAFDPANPETFDRRDDYLIHLLRNPMRRASIVLLAFAAWGLSTSGGISGNAGLEEMAFSGPFVVRGMPLSLGGAALFVGVWMCILTPTLLWVITGRARLAVIALLVGAGCVLMSIAFAMTAAC